MTRLAPPPSSPNCVSSRAPASDREHHIAPLSGVSLEAAKKALAAMPRTALVKEEPGYAHYVVTSLIFRFKDDVELEEEGGLVHVRSASRTGYGDMGVNRKRVEALRKVVSG
ncbi:MAG TPA: DUF1499 domain-containing protein [Myxococcota bacterium]|nr:DUF1499 domain-containing protein [Myxococcota bacterium]